MKRTILSFSFLLIIPGILFSQILPSMKGSEICSRKKSLSPYLPPSPGPADSGPVHSFNILNYTLNLDIFHCYLLPYPKSFSGNEIISFVVDSTLNAVQLNANSISLQINSVSLAGVGFTHAADLLTIQLNQTYQPGDTVQVGINFQHNNVTDNAFYVSDGFVYTDCEPEGARKWFPCWDRPSDKATWDLTVKVPLSVKLGSNGALADSTILNDTIWYHWISTHNIATYLMVISSKVNYHLDIVYWPTLSNPNDSTPIRFYYNDGEDPSAMEEIILPMCGWYSTNFCEHPFQKDGFATLNNEFSWGGMENQTLTSLCPGCWSESLIAHEFAHQWFGDMITCATWADIWLNEGYATWTEAFWYESYAGYNAYKTEIDGNAAYYLDHNPGWAISEPEWAIVTPPSSVLFNYAVTYLKGSTILHMLRYVLGDSLFFTVMQNYSNDPDLKYHAAVIPDFMAIVNEVTGENYDWFFNQWIYEPNHPDYRNSYNFQDIGSGLWKVNFYTEQAQPDPDFFKMPMEIKIHFSDYSDTVLRIMNDIDGQLFAWIFDKHPVNFQFDPNNNIVIKEGSTVLSDDTPLTEGNRIHLSQNFPNPVTSTTTISFELAKPMLVKLVVSDLLGQEVLTLVNELQTAGRHQVQLEGRLLRKGLYYYSLVTPDGKQTKKLIINR